MVYWYKAGKNKQSNNWYFAVIKMKKKIAWSGIESWRKDFFALTIMLNCFKLYKTLVLIIKFPAAFVGQQFVLPWILSLSTDGYLWSPILIYCTQLKGTDVWTNRTEYQCPHLYNNPDRKHTESSTVWKPESIINILALQRSNPWPLFRRQAILSERNMVLMS